MDKIINNSKQKYSYWIIGLLLITILVAVLPFEEVFIGGSRVGVVEINSPIIDSKEIVENLNYFNRKSNISAIVIRLNTPGGGVAASQEIYQKVKKISETSEKPIIASMGGVAASGGYYIALGADTIIANPGTATGSIGVIMSYPIINDAMDKVGIKYETIKSGILKDSGSPFKDISKIERDYFQNLIDDLHSQFVKAVSIERKISLEIANKLSNGQVYSGNQALENSLIDMIGTFEDAVLLASRKAGFNENPKVIYPPKERKGLLDMIFGDILTSSSIESLFMFPIPEYKIFYDLK